MMRALEIQQTRKGKQYCFGMSSTVILLHLSIPNYALAQNYPNKPIIIIVPSSPGGATSASAIMIGNKLREKLGQPVVVDHRSGANGIVGTGIVAKAAPDGYTFLVGAMSMLTVNPSLYKNLPFDTVKDFAPVIMTSTFPMVLALHPSMPANSVKQLIALAKSKPGQLNYGSSGIGSSNHLAGELLRSKTGIDMVHIPYKGGGPLLTAAISGEVSLIFGTPPSTIPQVNAGKLKALAVSSSKRSMAYPHLPTVAEAGVPGFEIDSWNGVLFPAGTPKGIVSRLNTEIAKIMQMPDVREAMISIGAEPTITTPEEFAAIIKADTEKWAKLIKDKGIVIAE